MDVHLKENNDPRTDVSKLYIREGKSKNGDDDVLETVTRNGRIHHRHYVDRICDTLLSLMRSYVDCIDGKYTETVIECDGSSITVQHRSANYIVACTK